MQELLSPLQKQRLQELGVDLGSDVVWTLKADVGAQGVYNRTIDWSRYPVSKIHCLTVQRLLLVSWSPSVINGETTLKENEARQADTMLRILILLSQKYPNKSICELEQGDWIQLIVLYLFHVWQKDTKGNRKLIQIREPLSKQTLERVLSLLRTWFEHYQAGNISDGPDFSISTHSVEKVLKHEFKAIGLNLEDWKSGQSFGSIPFVISHLLLADALETQNSLRTQQLLAYFATIRENKAHQSVATFWEHGKTDISRYRHSGDMRFLSKSNRGTTKTRQAKETITKPLDLRLRELHSRHSPCSPFIFPWPNHASFLNDYNNLQSALYIIFLSVMGKRGPSEVITLKGIDITPSNKESGQGALMRPSIQKTNQGLRQEQGVTNFIDESFKIISLLSYHDKTGTKLPLFNALQPMNNANSIPKPLSIDRAHKRLDDYYDSFCKRTNSKVDFDLLEHHKKISSHQFRHSFAEFALRKFDGNVEELIRQHFCHRFGHWWTQRYTSDKLDEQQTHNINRMYIRELVPQIVYDNTNTPDFVGAIALYIKKELADKVKVLSPQQAEVYIESLCEEVIQISAHEYGFCILHQRFRSMANCQNTNGIPEPSNTSFEKCSHCANFCASRKSHLTKQEQIVISHIDFIEQDVWKLPSMIERSRKAVQRAQRLFPELNKYGEV